MCSILGLFEPTQDARNLREQALRLSKRMRHRGPDWSGIHAEPRALLVHERLSIVDVEGGSQPLYGPDRKTVLAVNGEIYNHRLLRHQLAEPYAFATKSDCEIILALYADRGTDFLPLLNGIFGFALYDSTRDRYLIARDPIGVIPLYWGRDAQGQLLVASELKALVGVCTKVEDFPPGHFYDSEVGKLVRYYEPSWRDYDNVRSNPYDPSTLRTALEQAVHRQLMCDVPYGVLLSGGLDSSLTSALAKRYSQKRIEADDQEPAWWPQLHSFAIGLPGSPDLAAAAQAAQALGTVHHALEYSFQEGLDALEDVIYHIETYDVTTIRASTPMYLMARRIKAMGIKMVLTGEGSDEIFGGYLYFHKAPDERAFHEETVRKLDMLYKYDCLRANKSMAAWGIEARVPFLDLEFLDTAMRLPTSAKMCRDGRMEKHALREACTDLLPEEIVWRQKEQFSDGVGYGWIDGLKAHAERMVSDADMRGAAERFPVNTPATKEAFFYRALFEKHFPGEQAAALVPHGPSIACSTPTALAWEASFANAADPSGRAIKGVHQKAY